MEETQNTTTEMVQEKSKSFGPLIGILIIVLVLVFGGLYFWGASLQQITPSADTVVTPSKSFEPINTTTEEYTMTDEEFNALFGDNQTVVEEGLNTAFDDLRDLDSLDAELGALELEL